MHPYRNKRGFALIGIVLIFASCSTGGSPDIVVRGATVAPSHMMKGAASSFMFIINDGAGSDVLLGCSLPEHPSVRCELHDIRDGKMVEIGQLPVPAHATTELKRGGLHIMLFNIADDIEETVTFLMDFNKSGRIAVKANTISPDRQMLH